MTITSATPRLAAPRTGDGIDPHPGQTDQPQNNVEALPAPDFVDISRHNGKVDWKEYAAAGKKVGVCKITEGGDWLDAMAATNREGMKNNNLRCGLYHFAGSSGGGYINDADKEADNYLSRVGTMADNEFPVLDFEMVYGQTGPEMTSWISKWCTRIEQQTGKTPWLYTNHRIRRQLDGTNLTRYPLWIADYRSSDRENPPASQPWPNLFAWQYSEKASSPGVPATCDGNFLYGTLPEVTPPPPSGGFVAI
ncbi:hypothetical protein IV102_23815 [bacterium]|nr:hypothetical protein [bacterium]